MHRQARTRSREVLHSPFSRARAGRGSAHRAGVRPPPCRGGGRSCRSAPGRRRRAPADQIACATSAVEPADSVPCSCELRTACSNTWYDWSAAAVPCRRGLEDQPYKRGFERKAHVRARHAARRIGRTRVGGERSAIALLELRVRLGADGVEQGGLVREVPVGRGLGNARAAAGFAQRPAFRAGFPHQLARRSPAPRANRRGDTRGRRPPAPC